MANGIDALLRGLSAAAPAFAGGIQGFQQGQELQRQRTAEEEERARRAQQMALERSLTEARIEDLLSRAEERRRPQASEAPFRVNVGGVTTRARTPEEALSLRQQFALPEEPEEPEAPNLQRFNVPGQGEFTFNPQTGAVQPITVGGEQLRAAEGAGEQPASIRQSVADNRRQVSVIQSALEGLEERPESVGPQFALPGAELAGQFLDPEGVRVRADIADVGSLEIRDRSGASVTVSESPRLRPFIPSPGDTSQAAEVKLRRLLALIEEETRLLEGGAPGETPPVPPATEGAVGPTREFGEARSLVQGMAPDTARDALRQAGFSDADIRQILGS